MDRYNYEDKAIGIIEFLLENPPSKAEERKMAFDYMNLFARWRQAEKEFNQCYCEFEKLSDKNSSRREYKETKEKLELLAKKSSNCENDLHQLEKTEPLKSYLKNNKPSGLELLQQQQEEKISKLIMKRRLEDLKNGKEITLVVSNKNQVKKIIPHSESASQCEKPEGSTLPEKKKLTETTLLSAEPSNNVSDKKLHQKTSDNKQDKFYYFGHFVLGVFTLLSLYFVNFGTKTPFGFIVIFSFLALFPTIGGYICVSYWGFILITNIINPYLNIQRFIVTDVSFIFAVISFFFIFRGAMSFPEERKTFKKAVIVLLAISIPLWTTFTIRCANADYSIPETKSEYVKSTFSLISLSEYVSPGEDAYISVKAKPKTEYSIFIKYNSGLSDADGLKSKFSNDSGEVSWSWKVGTRTTNGTYPIKIEEVASLDSETYYFTVK